MNPLQPPTTAESSWAAYLELMKERPDLFEEDARLPIILDEQIVKKFCLETGKMVGIVYQSPYHLLVVDLVRDATGMLFTYERLINAVTDEAIVAIPQIDNHFVLLRQFRHALRTTQLCFPRGYGERGLNAECNARKELREELGATVKKMKTLGYTIADSGVSGTKVRIILCELSSLDANIGHEGIEDVLTLSQVEIDSLISAGDITDGFTLAAWAMYHAGTR